jgi:hypothetical protein
MASKQRATGSHVPLIHQIKEKSGKIRKPGSRCISSSRRQSSDLVTVISTQSAQSTYNPTQSLNKTAQTISNTSERFFLKFLMHFDFKKMI